jgi:hypothetical protein
MFSVKPFQKRSALKHFQKRLASKYILKIVAPGDQNEIQVNQPLSELKISLSCP